MSTQVKTRECSVPLVVGVVGHRDLTNSDELGRQVRTFLSELQALVPHTRLILLSSFAAGADLLVATIAYELHIRVVPVLALPPEVFARTFEPTMERELATYHRLLQQPDAEPPIVLPMPDGKSAADVLKDKDLLERQYAAAGAYVVRASHTILALWDGIETDIAAGTAAAVRYAELGVPPDVLAQRDPLDLADGGSVRWFKAKREKPKSGSPRAHSTWIHPRSYPSAPSPGHGADDEQDSIADQLRKKGLQRLDNFNEALRALGEQASRSQQTRLELGAHLRSVLPDDATYQPSAAEHALSELRARADLLSVRHQRRSDTFLRCAFGLGLAAVLALEVFAHFSPDAYLVLGLYALLLLVALWFLGARAEQFRCFVDYRAVAEALRVQFFWSAAGIRTPVSDHFMRSHRTEVEWIRQAAAAVSTDLRLSTSVAAPRTEGLALCRTAWIDGQRTYFTGKSLGLGKKGAWLASVSRNLATLAALLVFVTIAIGITASAMRPPKSAHVEAPPQPTTPAAAAAAAAPHNDAHPDYTLIHIVTILIAMLLVGAEIVRVYGDSGEFSTNSRRYLWMTCLFDHASRELATCLDRRPANPQRAMQTILSLGKAALAENSEWIVLHRHRPVELPHSIVNPNHH